MRRLLTATAIASVCINAIPHRPAGATNIVVNTTADEDINNATCSLREAIIAANSNASYHGCSAGAGVNDSITFNLGSGTPVINIGANSLPPILEWVTIDGGPRKVVLQGPGSPLVSGRHGLIVAHAGSGTTIRNLVINSFPDDGIFIDADEVSVLGCFIGTDSAGKEALPNQGYNVQVGNGNGVRIGGATSGGPCSGDCNLISAALDGKAEILLDFNATGARVRGNFIGTEVTGKLTFDGATTGIIDKGGYDTIGGTNGTTPGGACTGDCNVIAGVGSTNAAIVIDPAAINSTVVGNFVGTDVTGTNPPTNESYVGILSFATHATIGGTTPNARNIVSGSAAEIEVHGLSTVVQDNYIGTNSAGTAAVLYSGIGVLLKQANDVVVGGLAAGAGNVISGGYIGVDIEESSNTQILGNWIGTAVDGTTPLGNSSHGIRIEDQSSNNTIGGAGAARNIIAFNGEGVLVDGETPQVLGNAIRGNSIYTNDLGGISLVAGGNGNLAAPTITGKNPLRGTSCAPCTVEIFSDEGDQGRIFEGFVLTNTGDWTFNSPVTGPYVTATATDMNNNTSEFSMPVRVTTPTFTATRTATRTPTKTATGTSTQSPTPSPTASPTLTTSASPSRTTTPTNSRTETATGTPTGAATLTVTHTVTQTATPTDTVTATPTQTSTATLTDTPTGSATEAPPATQTGAATSTLTAIATTAIASPTPSPTVTGTQPGSGTPTPSATLTQTTAATPIGCVGDCDADGAVTVDELITLVNIALGGAEASACPHGVPDGVEVDISFIIQAVNNALNECPVAERLASREHTCGDTSRPVIREARFNSGWNVSRF